MKSFYLLPLAALAACSIGTDDRGPGIVGTGEGNARSFAASGFTRVKLSGGDDVDVRVGTGFSVRAEGPAAELAKLRIVRENDTLDIGRRTGSWGDGDKVRVVVTMPRIAGGAVAGSGNLAIDRIEGQRFDGAIAGSGNLTVGGLRVDETKIDIAGSGDVAATGTTRTLNVSIAGSGNIAAPGLVASGAKVSIAGAGDVRATVNGDADVDVLGAGDVDLGANARCKVSNVGAGDVRCGKGG